MAESPKLVENVKIWDVTRRHYNVKNEILQGGVVANIIKILNFAGESCNIKNGTLQGGHESIKKWDVSEVGQWNRGCQKMRHCKGDVAVSNNDVLQRGDFAADVKNETL